MKKSSTVIPIFTFLLWLIFCQIAFFHIQKNQSIGMTRLIQSNLLESLGNSDFFSLGKAISNLVTANLISCPHLELTYPTRRLILGTQHNQTCRKSDHLSQILLNGVHVETQLSALNGDQYSLSFRTRNQQVFTLALWGIRIVGLIGIICATFLIRLQQRIIELNLNAEIELARAKHEIAQRLAHDIRSPLTALNLSTQNLPEGSDAQKSMILQAAHRIAVISEDLLKEPLPSVRMNPRLGEISLADEISDLTKEKEVQFSDKKINFSIKSDSLTPQITKRVRSDDLIRSISNILNNAAEASTPKSIVYLEIFSTDKFTHFRVTDSGSGIPEHLLPKIGKEKVTTKDIGGNGLGLYHIRKIFEPIGGNLELTSKIGFGTQVTLTVPRL